MVKKETSLSHLLFLSLLGTAVYADGGQVNSSTDASTCQSAKLWTASLEDDAEVQSLLFMQLRGLRKFKDAAQGLSVSKTLIPGLHQRSDQTGVVPPGYLPPETDALPNMPISSLCGHSLSGVDDEAVFSFINRAHKASAASTVIARSGPLRTLQQQNIFIAVCLHESAAIMPYWTVELVRLLMALRATRNSTKLFVSVYESGSADSTSEYLVLLEKHLKLLGVPNKIVTGGLLRKPGRERIDFLAELRNRALKPLRESSHHFDHVLWLSDNLFCADGVLQMLAHALPQAKGGLGADAVCGTDYSWGDYKNVFDRCWFYDRWASHDIMGNNFGNDKPIINYWQHHKKHPGPDNAKLEAGEPFQVFSCWNAMVVFSADLFQKNIVSFRTNRKHLGECAAAETELIFRDMWAIGRGKILVSPRAASAYHKRDFNLCAVQKQPTRFDQPPRITWKSAPEAVTCCPLPAGQDVLDNWKSCFPERWSRFGAPGVMSNLTSSSKHSAGEASV